MPTTPYTHSMAQPIKVLLSGEPVKQSQRILLTIALYVTFFSYGAATSVYPTAMAEYVILITSNIEDFSANGLVAQAVAYCISALIGSSIANFVNRQIYLLLSIIVLIACQIWMPFTTNLTESTICLGVTGFGQAVVDIATNAWLLAIWRNSPRAESCLLGMHFSYALGGTMAPLFTEPFLVESLRKPVGILGSCIGNNVECPAGKSSNETRLITTEELKIVTQIYSPFFISAGLYFITLVLFVIIHFIKPYNENNEKLLEENNSNNSESSSFSYPLKHVILILAAMILMFTVGAEVSTFDFNTVFVIAAGFDQHKAAFISSAKSICFAISPALAAIAAFKIPVRVILYTSITISIIGNFILLYASTFDRQHLGQQEIYLYFGFSLVGLGFGPLYPAIYSFVERYITLGTVTCGIFVFVGSLSTILDFLVVGKYIEHQPNVLVYYNLVSVCGITIFFLVMDYMVKRLTIKKYVVSSHFKW